MQKNFLKSGSDLAVAQYLGRGGMGGAEVYAALIANVHAENQGRAHVIIRSSSGPISGRLAENVHVHYLNYSRASIRKPFAFLRSLWTGYTRLCEVVKENNIDVLQTHLPDENMWGLLLALRGKCNVVVTIHNNNFLEAPEGTWVGKAVRRLAYRLMLKACLGVVVVSEEVGESYRRVLNLKRESLDRVTVINNGVLIPDLIGVESMAVVRKKYAIEPSGIWIVAAGRLSKAKNFCCLVKAVANLKARGTQVTATIGGEGELRADLEQEINALGLQAEVRLPGILDDLQDIMQSADLLAMPSLWEGLPLTLLEAMACGMPVVGTRINGLQEIVTEGKQGHLVPVDDHVALADAIQLMVDNPEGRQAMGRASRELASEKYSFSRVYSQLCEIYTRAARA